MKAIAELPIYYSLLIGLFFLLSAAICLYRQKKPIGGWLLWFIIDIFILTISPLFLLPLYIKGLPNLDAASHSYKVMFIIKFIANLVNLLPAIFTACLLIKRNLFFLKLLRFSFCLAIIAQLIIIYSYKFYFPHDMFEEIKLLVIYAVNLIYFSRSKRVKHVFISKDWSENKASKLFGLVKT